LLRLLFTSPFSTDSIKREQRTWLERQSRGPMGFRSIAMGLTSQVIDSFSLKK